MEEICKTHNLPCNHYDYDCTTFICPRCMLGTIHKDHQCKFIDDVLEELQENLQLKLKTLQDTINQDQRVLERFQAELTVYLQQLNSEDVSKINRFVSLNSISNSLEVLELLIAAGSVSNKSTSDSTSNESNPSPADDATPAEIAVNQNQPASFDAGDIDVVLLEATEKHESNSGQDSNHLTSTSESLPPNSLVSGDGIFQYYKNLFQVGEDRADFKILLSQEACSNLNLTISDVDSSVVSFSFIAVEDDPNCMFVRYTLASDFNPDIFMLNVTIGDTIVEGSPFCIRIVKVLPHRLVLGKNVEISEDGQKALAIKNRAWCRVEQSIILYEEIFLRISKGDKNGWCAVRFYDTIDIRFQEGNPSEGMYCWNLRFGTFLIQGKAEGKNDDGKYDGTDRFCDISFYRDDTGIHCFCRNIPVYQFHVPSSVIIFVFINNNNVTSITELLNYHAIPR